MSPRPERHFPKDYRTARTNFIAACEAADLGVTTRVHPSEKGADGKPLFLDTVTIGALDAPTAMLLISGTHGVEGYFGSAAQTGLVREGLAKRIADGTKLVILHALNPFGFAFDRRVNEDNADINRNFVDHAHPPANKAYEQLAPWIAPKDISKEAMRAANARLRAFSEEHGAFALQEAISRGQYRFADGLYFGGARESWSARMLRDVLKEDFAHVKKLVVIDFHTGLGEHGAGEMITEDLPGSKAYGRQKAIWGERVKSSEAGESVSAPLVGTIDKAMAEWGRDRELTFAALEVGTLPVRDVFNALRKDNWLYCFARGVREHADDIRHEIRAAFYPETRDWKRAVFGHAEDAVNQALRTLA
jgi:uncharacterized protein DUF2817